MRVVQLSRGDGAPVSTPSLVRRSTSLVCAKRKKIFRATLPFDTKVENAPPHTKVPAQQCKPAVDPYSLRPW